MKVILGNTGRTLHVGLLDKSFVGKRFFLSYDDGTVTLTPTTHKGLKVRDKGYFTVDASMCPDWPLHARTRLDAQPDDNGVIRIKVPVNPPKAKIIYTPKHACPPSTNCLVEVGEYQMSFALPEDELQKLALQWVARGFHLK